MISARAARRVVRAALALAVLGFVPGLLDPFNAPKAAVIRIAGLALLAAALVGGLALRLGPARAAGSARMRPLDMIVGAWVAIAALATAFGISPRLSLMGEIEQREGLVTIVALAGLYLGARRAHAAPGSVRGTVVVLLGAASVAAVYALLQRGGLDPLPWTDVPSYPQGGSQVLRPFATLGNPILLGAVLAPALAVAVADLALERAALGWSGPAAALLSVAIVATLSRGAWAAAAAGVLAALAVAVATNRAALRRVVLALGCSLLPALAWGALTSGGALMARIGESVAAGGLSLPARAEMARGVLDLGRRHPWLGVGPDAFGLAFPAVQRAELWRQEWIGIPAHAHSVVLQVLATLGACGLAVGLAWLAAVVLALVRGARASGRAETAALAGALTALAVGGALNVVGLAAAVGFVVLSALAVAGTEPEVPDSRPTERVAVPGRGPAAAAALTVVAALAFPTERELMALADAAQSRGALLESLDRDGRVRARLFEVALARAREATRLAPGEDELWRLECDAALAVLRSGAGRGDSASAPALAGRAERAARAALRLEPERASNYQRLANALAARARVARSMDWERVRSGTPPLGPALALAAEKTFAEAERRAPADALILTDHATADLTLGRAEAALAAARRIVALYPEAASGHALEAAALLALGRTDEARAALLRASVGRWEAEDAERREAVDRLLEQLEGGGSPPD